MVSVVSLSYTGMVKNVVLLAQTSAALQSKKAWHNVF